jgi:hypothetical protein
MRSIALLKGGRELVKPRNVKKRAAVHNARINWKFEYGGARRSCELLTPRSEPR